MYFIRHNKLQFPYNDYSALTLDQLEDLAISKVDPSVQIIKNLNNFESYFLDYLMTAKIVCSESDRTQQTAKLILDLLKVPIKLEINSQLNEIYFSPKNMLGDENLSKGDLLPYIRQNIYYKMFEKNSGVEFVEQIEERTLSILDQYKNQKVVLFTHGFLIKFILAYKANNFITEKTSFLKNLQGIEPINYLERFEF